MSETQDLSTGFVSTFDDTASLTAQVVSAYVAKVPVSQGELQTLIRATHATFRDLDKPEAPAEPVAAVDCTQTPKAIRDSITPDGLTSFIDGASYKTLKRHLATHGMDAASYRTRFGLPSDYPMVCASYSAQRSALAKELGLGRPGGRAPAPAPEAADTSIAA